MTTLDCVGIPIGHDHLRPGHWGKASSAITMWEGSQYILSNHIRLILLLKIYCEPSHIGMALEAFPKSPDLKWSWILGLPSQSIRNAITDYSLFMDI